MEVMEYSEEEVEEMDERENIPERLASPVPDEEAEIVIPSDDTNVDTSIVKNETICDNQTDSTTEKLVEPEEESSDEACPICMDSWTTSGEHRLCCLRCGHLFGYSCILRWLQISCTKGNRRCPHCNKKAAIKDIRLLYARKLTSIDTTEIEGLKMQLLAVTNEKQRLESELTRSNLRQKVYEEHFTDMKNRIAQLESQLADIKRDVKKRRITLTHNGTQFQLEHSIEISQNGCRVLGYNPWYHLVVISQKSPNPVFNGYGIKKVYIEDLTPRQFIFLHTQPIRDLSFHQSEQSMLLSVGLDKCAKLIDINNNVLMHTYKTNYTLWSCCWSGDDPNIFFAGTQNGSVMQFDIRQTSSHIDLLENLPDKSPVVSLATVPADATNGVTRGGFIRCCLNSCYAYERKESTYVPKQLDIEGPFLCVRYDKTSNHALISCRPSDQHRDARHIVCSFKRGADEMILCNTVHTFHAGNSQRLMSRPCFVSKNDEMLVAAHQESTGSIPFWSISTGKQKQNLTVSEPVLDMCSFKNPHNPWLTTLSANKISFYTDPS